MNMPLPPHCSGHKHFEYDCIDCSDALERMRKGAAPGDGTYPAPRPWETAQRHYRGFDIKLKRDFGSAPRWIDGMPCMWGYVVCYGATEEYAGCNAMPAATWFQTVKEAQRAIDVLIEVGGDADAFWNRFRDAGMPTHVETASMPNLAGTMPGTDKAENRVEVPVPWMSPIGEAVTVIEKTLPGWAWTISRITNDRHFGIPVGDGFAVTVKSPPGMAVYEEAATLGEAVEQALRRAKYQLSHS